MNNYLKSIILLLAIQLFSCAKENKYNYLNIEITVTDFYTGQPVKWNAYTEYTSKGKKFTTSIGSGIGYKHIVMKRPGKGSSYDVRIFFDQENYAVYPNLENMSNAIITVNSGEKHTFTFQAKPTRRFKFILTNTNCQSSNDSLFIKHLERPESPDRIYKGCLNQFEAVNQNGWSGFFNTPDVNFRIKTVKNGVIDSFFVQQQLDPFGITPVYINY
ncbi:MAG: hypothetical protein IT221_06815 [Fluviicola sp.]|nr:hypothetical protein [Fluviicola sp.]